MARQDRAKQKIQAEIQGSKSESRKHHSATQGTTFQQMGNAKAMWQYLSRQKWANLNVRAN